MYNYKDLVMSENMMCTIGSNFMRSVEGIAAEGRSMLDRVPKIDNLSIVKEAYYNEFSPEERKKECERIRGKYPDRIPVICEKAFNSSIAQVDKRKFLVPMDLTVGQFLYVIRGRMKLRADEALFVFVGGHLPPTGGSMQELYEKHRSEDGFLYLTYNGENTFGAM